MWTGGSDACGWPPKGGTTNYFFTPTPFFPACASYIVGTLASNSEFEIDRYLHLGETVTATTVIESISEEKQTRLGPGHFVTWVTTYVDEQNEIVGRQRFRILKFKPGGTATAAT